MDYKDFEKRLHDSVDEFVPQNVDHVGMWEAIETDLDGEKKKRRFIWFVFGIGLLLTCGGIVLSGILGTSARDLQSEVVRHNERADLVSSVSPLENIEQEIFHDEPLYSENSVAEEYISEEDIVENSNKRIAKRTTTEGIVGKANLASTDIVAVKKYDLAEKLLEKPKLSEVKKDVRETRSDLKDPLEAEPLLTKEHSTGVMKSEEERNGREENVVLEVEQESEIGQNIATESDDELIEEKVIPISTPVEDTDVHTTDLLMEEESSVITPKQKELKSRFRIGFSGAVYKPLVKYFSTISDSEPLIESLDEKETELEALDARLILGLRLSRSWTVASGIAYSRINQASMNTKVYMKSQIKPDAIIGRVVNSANGPYDLTGDGVVESIVTEYYARYLSYSSLAVPVVLYYSPVVLDRWEVQFVGGVEFSLKSWANGYLQDPNEIEYNLEIDMDKRLRSRSSHYGLLGMQVRRSLSDRIDFLLGIETKIPLSVLTTENSVIQKQFMLPGFRSGITINI